MQDELAGALGQARQRLEAGDVDGWPAQILADHDGNEQMAIAGADAGRLVEGPVAPEQHGQRDRSRRVSRRPASAIHASVE